MTDDQLQQGHLSSVICHFLPSIPAERIPPARSESFDRSKRFLSFVEKSRIHIIKSIQSKAWHLLVDVFFNVGHRLEFFGGHQGKSVSSLFGAPRPTNTMDIIFRMKRDIIIHDVSDPSDI